MAYGFNDDKSKSEIPTDLSGQIVAGDNWTILPDSVVVRIGNVVFGSINAYAKVPLSSSMPDSSDRIIKDGLPDVAESIQDLGSYHIGAFISNHWRTDLANNDLIMMDAFLQKVDNKTALRADRTTNFVQYNRIHFNFMYICK